MKRLDERSQWENEWAEAFQNERQDPPERVWKNLDAVLANKEVKKYKKRAIYYKWLAAASVLVSICGAVLLLQSDFTGSLQPQTADRAAIEVKGQEPVLNSDSETGNGEQAEKAAEEKATPVDIAQGQNAVAEKGTAESLPQPLKESANASRLATTAKTGQSGTSGFSTKEGNSGALAAAAQEQETGIGKSEKMTIEEHTGENAAYLAVQQEEENRQINLPAQEGLLESANASLLASREEKQEELKRLKKKGFIEEDYKTGVRTEMQKVWVASDMLKKGKEASPKYLLGASLASGYFDPRFQESDLLMASMQESNALNPKKGQISAARLSEWDQEEENPVTMNGGVQAAAWISKKWVVQGGVQYGNYKSAGQAGSYVDSRNKQAYPLHYSNFSADKVQRVSAGSRISAPVSVVNSFEFISVPLSVGYIVFDRKVGLMVSPGISSEFFLSNQLSGEGHGLSTYTSYGGAESPYNRVHLRGHIGAQLYYKLGDHYMISLEPTYQHSITDFHKSDSYFKSRPTNMGVAAGFRYIIR